MYKRQEYVLTAPDGVTKITYTVTVVFYDDSQGGSEETPHIHTWDTGAVTKKPTCTEDGLKTYTCTGCKEIRLESIEKTGHITVIDEAVAVGCESAGKTAGSHCSVCGLSLIHI